MQKESELDPLDQVYTIKRCRFYLKAALWAILMAPLSLITEYFINWSHFYESFLIVFSAQCIIAITFLVIKKTGNISLAYWTLYLVIKLFCIYALPLSSIGTVLPVHLVYNAFIWMTFAYSVTGKLKHSIYTILVEFFANFYLIL